jgi:hypothetical protein
MVQPTAHKPPPQSRMSLANVTRGKQDKPLALVLYGPEGVGKSTFAAGAESPVFLCTEQGTAQLDVVRFPTPRNWADVLEAVRVLTYEEHDYKTLVIDTLDWLEPLCWAHVCAVGGKAGIEDFGYGKGYTAAIEQWRVLIQRLELLQNTRRTVVIVLAHASAKNHKDPTLDAFQRWQLRVHAGAGDLFKEWSDAVLFARHETFTTKTDGKNKGISSGARVMHTRHTAGFDAKNRFNLPETIPLSWKEFFQAATDPAALRARAQELLQQLPEEKREVVSKAISDAGDDANKLVTITNRINATIATIAKENAA